MFQEIEIGFDYIKITLDPCKIPIAIDKCSWYNPTSSEMIAVFQMMDVIAVFIHCAVHNTTDV